MSEPTYVSMTAGQLKIEPGSQEKQKIYDKDGTIILMDGDVQPSIYFEMITSGKTAFTEEAMLAILYHRMRLKHTETGNDQWLVAAKYIEDVEESVAAAKRQDAS